MTRAKSYSRVVSDGMIAEGIAELRTGIESHATDRQTVANVFVAMATKEIEEDVGGFPTKADIKATLAEARELEIPAIERVAEALQSIDRALTAYHAALDLRQDGRVASDKLVRIVERAIGHHWSGGN